MKTCSKCKIEKDESMFYKHRTTKDNLWTKCKDCMRIENYEYRMKHKDMIDFYNRRKCERVSKERKENKRRETIEMIKYCNSIWEFCNVDAKGYDLDDTLNSQSVH